MFVLIGCVHLAEMLGIKGYVMIRWFYDRQRFTNYALIILFVSFMLLACSCTKKCFKENKKCFKENKKCFVQRTWVPSAKMYMNITVCKCEEK